MNKYTGFGWGVVATGIVLTLYFSSILIFGGAYDFEDIGQIHCSDMNLFFEKSVNDDYEFTCRNLTSEEVFNYRVVIENE